MRLAGTWKQYSPNAISQLTRMAATIGAERYLRCPYHAKVMKVFEMIRRMTVHMRDVILRRSPQHFNVLFESKGVDGVGSRGSTRRHETGECPDDEQDQGDCGNRGRV